jgi:hypothetical protein
MSNQQHEGRIYGPTPFGLLDSQTAYWVRRAFPQKQKEKKFNLKVAVGLGLISVGLSGCTLSSPIAAPLPQDYVIPPLLTPEPSATPTFIPPTTTPEPSETPKPPVTSTPTVRPTNTSTPTPKDTPTPTITREPTATYEQQLLKQINSLSKTSILPTLFDDISKHKGPTAALNKDGKYVLSVVNYPVDSFTFNGNSTRSLGIVVTADYKVLQGNARPNGIFITTDWLTNPNRNLIEVRRFYSDLLKKEIFTVMYGTITDNVFHGIEVPLPPHQSPNPTLVMLFSADMKTFTLSELSPDGKSLNVLSGVSFGDLKDGAGNKVFPKDTFTDFKKTPAGWTVHEIYSGIAVTNGHQMTVSKFDYMY